MGLSHGGGRELKDEMVVIISMINALEYSIFLDNSVW